MLVCCVGIACALYGGDGDSIDELRYRHFCSKTPPSNRLPPCRDALQKHASRANYQAFIWKSALNATEEIPSPRGNGWQLENGVLSVDWMDKHPAPRPVLELIKCSCSAQCSSARCSCYKHRMACSECCGWFSKLFEQYGF